MLCVCVCVCVQLEERARKPVEQATSSSSVLKLYNKWVERSQHSAEGEGGDGEKKVGLLKTIKSAIHKQGKDQTVRPQTVCVEYSAYSAHL